MCPHLILRNLCDSIQKPSLNTDQFTMEKKVLLVSSILSVSLWCLSVQASGGFLGCKDFCASQYDPATNFKGYDNCLVQTQIEGYCGRRPGATVPAAQTREAPPTNTQQQNQNQSANQNAQCQTQFQQMYQQCTTAIEDTSNMCDEKNDAGMNSVSASASQIALMMGQQTAASIQAACSKMADISQAANGAVAAYRLACSNSIKSCRSTCVDLVNYAKANSTCFSGSAAVTLSSSVSSEVQQVANQLRNQNGLAMTSSAEALAGRCNNYDAKLNEAQQAISNYGMTAANASQCAELSKGTTTAVPEFCKANPTYAGCNPAAPVDCSNPEMATTNKVCVCSVNPNNPICSNSQKVAGDGPNTSLIDSASRVATAGGAEEVTGDLPGLPSITHGKLPGGGSGDSVDGQQGVGSPVSGSSSGSGGLAGKNAGAGERAAAANAEGVLGGTYGGGGSYRGVGGGGSGEGSSAARGVAANNPGVPGQGGPDLRQFLPGGKYDPRSRGIAGASGPDGITGPHSNIWQKIQNRYQVVRPSLMP